VGKYVVFAGMLVDTGELATIVLIILVVILILSLEVYRRRRLRGRKAGKESSDK
jgi:hypothetical protein